MPERRDRARLLQTAWLPLTYAPDAVNRSMGKEDLSPVGLGPAILADLDHVHRSAGHPWHHTTASTT